MGEVGRGAGAKHRARTGAGAGPYDPTKTAEFEQSQVTQRQPGWNKEHAGSWSGHEKEGWGGPCFVAGTPIQTAAGVRPIESIQVGDLVWARDEATGEIDLKVVERVFVHPVTAVVQVSIEYGYGDRESIRATTEHPFWVEGRGWVGISHLQPGDVLVTVSGQLAKVLALHEDVPAEPVYNFQVAEFHTYFVGESGCWVHNQSRIGGGRQNALTNAEARDLADKLGYTRVKDPPFDPHGQLVFKSGNRYISPDIDVHNPGSVWKMFNAKGVRVGTYNADLTIRIKD